MSIYKLKADFENYFSFTIENAELFGKMPSFSAKFKAKPRIQDWNEPTGHFYQSENYKSSKINLPDITTWLLGNLVLNEKAYQALKPSLEHLGEFLPINGDGTKYYAFNNLHIINDAAIDQEATKPNIQSGVNMGLERLAFILQKTNKELVFKTNADNLAALYCTDNFKALIEKHGLKGLIFESNLTSS